MKENIHFFKLEERNAQVMLWLEIPGPILWSCVSYHDDFGETEFLMSCMVKRVGSGQDYVIARTHMIILAKKFVKMVFSIDCEIFSQRLFFLLIAIITKQKVQYMVKMVMLLVIIIIIIIIVIQNHYKI